MTHTIAIICAIIAIVLTPVYLVLFARGTSALKGLDRSMSRPVTRRDHGPSSSPRG